MAYEERPSATPSATKRRRRSSPEVIEAPAFVDDEQGVLGAPTTNNPHDDVDSEVANCWPSHVSFDKVASPPLVRSPGFSFLSSAYPIRGSGGLNIHSKWCDNTYASATGKEVADSDGIGVPRPKRVLTTSLESTLSLAATLCSQEEGFVVADSAGNRIKVKGKDYCKVHSNPARFDALWFHALSFYLQPPPSKEMREGVLRSVPGIAVVLEWLEATLVPDLTLLSERLSYDLKLEAELMKHPEKTVSVRQSHGKAPRALRNVKSVWDKALSLKLRGALADQGCIDITGAQLLQLARPRPASAGAGAAAGATVVDSNEVRSVMKELILNHVASVSKKAKILNATSGFSITQLRKLKRGH